jgi:hypothetical protein
MSPTQVHLHDHPRRTQKLQMTEYFWRKLLYFNCMWFGQPLHLMGSTSWLLLHTHTEIHTHRDTHTQIYTHTHKRTEIHTQIHTHAHILIAYWSCQRLNTCGSANAFAAQAHTLAAATRAALPSRPEPSVRSAKRSPKGSSDS